MAARKRGLKIQNIVMQAGLIDELQLRSAVARGEQWGTRLPRTLDDMNICTEVDVMNLVADALRMPLTPLAKAPRDSAALSKLTEEFCVEWGVFPMQLKNRVLTLAMADPTELDLIDEIQSTTQCRVQPALAMESDILAAIKREYVKLGGPRTGEVPAPRRTVEFHIPGENEFDFNPGEAAVTAPAMPPIRRATGPSIPQPRVPPPVESLTLFSASELEQLKAVQENQEKTRRISQAVHELLREKGLLT